MADKLEQFIREHREDFDQATPNLRVWAALNKNLSEQQPAPKRRRLMPLLRIAAAVVLLLSIGAAAGVYFSQPEQSETEWLAEQFPEFSETQAYYVQQVSEKMNQLQQYNYVSPINEDLIEIDGFIEELRQQLSETPRGSEATIINAMIQNYRTKLEILERVLNRLETRGKGASKKENNAQSTI
ncbi:MAG: hypothetical protein AAFO94_01230 [Bacteroidota bacterium]